MTVTALVAEVEVEEAAVEDASEIEVGLLFNSRGFTAKGIFCTGLSGQDVTYSWCQI